MGEEACGARGQKGGSFELREGGGDRREAARSVGGGGIQVGKSRWRPGRKVEVWRCVF